MIALLCFILRLSVAPFRSPSRLVAENAALRHQLVVLQRKVGGRVEFTNADRLFFVLLYRWFPSILKAITIVRPETVVRWHRAGGAMYRPITWPNSPHLRSPSPCARSPDSTIECSNAAGTSSGSRWKPGTIYAWR